MDKNRKTNSWKTGRATPCPIRQPVALTYAPALNVLNLKYLISTDFRVRIRSRESYRGETVTGGSRSRCKDGRDIRRVLYRGERCDILIRHPRARTEKGREASIVSEETKWRRI